MKNRIRGGGAPIFKKLSIFTLLFVMLFGMAIPVSAAQTYHATLSGNTKVESVGSVNDTYVKALHDIVNDNYSESSTKMTSTGWSTTTEEGGNGRKVYYYIKSSGGTTTSNPLTVTYPKYLKIGSTYYDLELKVTSMSSENGKGFIVFALGPHLALVDSRSVCAVIDNKLSALSSVKGSCEIGMQINIYEAGTTTKAKIPNIHMAIADLDAENGGYSSDNGQTEAWTIPSFNASSSNTYLYNSMKGLVNYNNGSFFGLSQTNYSTPMVFLKINELSNGSFNSYYGWYANSSTTNAQGGTRFIFYSTTYTVTYKSDSYGSITGITSQEKFENENPTATSHQANSGYYSTYWTCDKAVTLEDGTKIAAGGQLTTDQVKQVVVKSDLTFTVHHAPYLKVSYEWSGSHPSKTVPSGKTNIKSGDSYTVDTSYKKGDKVTETALGIWTFNGWDKSGTLTITNDTVIKGTWTLNPNKKVSYVWDGEHPNKTVPAGKTGILPGSNYTVDTTYKPGDTVYATNVTYNGKTYPRGTWTFNKWDKTGTFAVNEDTVIHGTWTFTPEWNIDYKWEGDHPNKTVPTGKNNIPNGTAYTVDTTYKQGDTVYETNVSYDGRTYPRGTWTFDRWDKMGTFNVTADTTINGRWNFTPEWNVTYHWKGDHPKQTVPASVNNIPNGTIYNVDKTYLPGQVVYEEDVTYEGVKYPRGTWTFNRWDRMGSFAMTSDVDIYGTWGFTPEWNIETSAENGTITETEKNIPNGENRVVTYTPNPGYQLKTLTVDGENKDIDEYPASYPFEDINVDHTVVAVFELIPELSIEKVSDKTIYNAGDIATYTITVKQVVEGAEARSVTITDVIPDGLTLIQGSITGPVIVEHESNNEYTVSIASLETEVTFTYKAYSKLAVDMEKLINVAEADGGNVPHDPVKDDNTIKSLTPKPVITKIVSNENPIYGEEITYTVSVKEPQEGIVLRNMVVTDPIPDGIEFIDDTIEIAGEESTAVYEDGVLKVTLDELHDETVISFKARITAVEGDVINIATLNGDQIEELKDDTPITVKEPTPTIVKEANVSRITKNAEYVAYTITVSTDIDLVDVNISDVLPEGIKGAEELTCNYEDAVITDALTLENTEDNNVTVEDSDTDVKTAEEVLQESRDGKVKNTASTEDAEVDNAETNDTQAEFNVHVEKLYADKPLIITYKSLGTVVGDHTNVATVEAYNFPKGPAKDETTVNVYEPTPVIEKTVLPESVSVSETVTYTIRMYTKEGILLDALMGDAVPSELTLLPDTLSCDREDAEIEVHNNAFTVNTPKLDNNPVTITFKAAVNKAGEFVNTAVLVGSNYTGAVIDSATVKGIEPTPVIEKTVDNESVSVSETATYTIKAYAKDATLYNAVVTDILPEGVVMKEKTLKAIYNGDTITEGIEITSEGFTAEVPYLSETVLLVVSFDVLVPAEGEYLNTATLTGSNYDGAAVADTAPLKAVEPVPVIDKTASATSVALGQYVGFTISMHAENATLYNAVLTDTLPEGFALDESTIVVSEKSAVIKVEGQTLTVTIPALKDEEVTVFYKGVASEIGSLKNVAILTGDNYVGEPVEGDAVVTVTTKEATPVPTGIDTPVTTQTQTEQTTAVKTGDETAPVLYVSIIGLAILAIIGNSAYKRRKHSR